MVKEKHFLKFFLTIIFFISCSSTYKNRDIVGKEIPKLQGESLNKKSFQIPSDFKSKLNLLLIGYKQKSQFDIDRWLIGIDMRNINIPTYEIPAIKGFVPNLFKSFINDGMRSGIPNELWSDIITIYDDGEILQRFTGNSNPNNARVILLFKNKVIYFHDKGFSTKHLNKLIEIIKSKE